MTYKGRFRGGVVVLDGQVSLPEGAQVEVRLSDQDGERIPSLYERLEPVIGKAKGLPPDASSNVDHYLYGHSKQ